MQFHQEMLKRKKELRNSTLVGTPPGWFQFRAHEHFQTRLGQTPAGQSLTVSSARHHLGEGRKYRTADALSKGHYLATKLLLITGQNCSSQSLSQARPLCNLGELYCSFFPTQVQRTVKHLHLQNKTH